MLISDVPAARLRWLLRRGQLGLAFGPYVARIGSNFATLADDIGFLYADFPTADEREYADFNVAIRRDSGLRGWLKPRARFHFDEQPLFVPLPACQALPMLEWGLNWCVAAHCHRYLIIHAAAVEKNGKAVLLPGPPGSGKSTLCAALVCTGWRLLSDELTLYDPSTGLLSAMARPLSLKNESIEIIRTSFSSAAITPPVKNTVKGSVALLKPPPESVRRMHEPAIPALLIEPRFSKECAIHLEGKEKASSFMLLAEQSFNYHIHGKRGFRALAALLDRLSCFRLSYHDLQGALARIDRLIDTI